MHVWLRRLSVIIGILLTSVAHATDVKPVEYGKYVCVTDRAVGIQTVENGTKRFAGTIQMSPEKQRFFATISQIKRVDTYSTTEWLQDGVIQHLPDRCFGTEQTSKYEHLWETNELDHMGPNINDFSQWCLSRSAVKLTGVVETTYYSLGKNIFVNSMSDRFWITSDWGFIWEFTSGMGDHYMMEGRCDLIK